MRSSALRDVSPTDASVGIVVALGIWAVAFGVVWLSRLAWEADVRRIDPGDEIAIAVHPVLDARGGGSLMGTVRQLPGHWRRADESPTPAQAKRPASRRRPNKRRTKSRRRRSRAALPDVNEGPEAVGSPAEIVLPDLIDDESSGETAAGDSVAAAETGGVAALTGGTGAGEGGMGLGDGGTGAGEAIVAAYRARLIRWLSTRFRVSGSGLAPPDLLRFRVRATIEVGDDANVTGYKITSSGNHHFDAAAERALGSVRGEGLPEPPSGYPNALPRVLTVTFTCSESACD
ncbi:MAG: energy transducer TonB [Myxococcales bacterium FL481]|nr:MAG: energy transducer TonB [Myxococcales bacterium FL481]